MKSARPSDNKQRSLVGRFRAFIDALADRTQQVLKVLDEALASPDFKEKSWAVEFILKRLTPADWGSSKKSDAESSKGKSVEKLPESPDFSNLDDAELLRRLRQHIKDID